MKCNDEIRDELNDISKILADIGQTMPFSVPENYFFSFSNRLNIKIKSVNQTFTVPKGYFSKLPDDIMKSIHSEDLDESVSSLGGSEKHPPFTIPDNYFKLLPGKILQKVPQTTSVKSKVITVNFRARSIWKQAAAAVITGIIAINTLWIFNQSNDNSDKITEATGISSYRTAYNQYRSPEQIDEGLSKLSNDDIIKYLSVNGSESDNEALISNINENQLPDQDPSQSSDQSIKSYLNN